jgi:hypothetical protein
VHNSYGANLEMMRGALLDPGAHIKPEISELTAQGFTDTWGGNQYTCLRAAHFITSYVSMSHPQLFVSDAPINPSLTLGSSSAGASSSSF